jgi:hypothetical protein
MWGVTFWRHRSCVRFVWWVFRIPSSFILLIFWVWVGRLQYLNKLRVTLWGFKFLNESTGGQLIQLFDCSIPVLKLLFQLLVLNLELLVGLLLELRLDWILRGTCQHWRHERWVSSCGDRFSKCFCWLRRIRVTRLVGHLLFWVV